MDRCVCNLLIAMDFLWMMLFVGEEILFTSHRRLITIPGIRGRKHAALKALSRKDVLFADIR